MSVRRAPPRAREASLNDLLRPEPPVDWRRRLQRVALGHGLARLAVGLVAVVAMAIAAAWLLRAPAPPVEASLPMARAAAPAAPSPSGPAGAVGAAPDTTAATELVVQAAGAVARPGVYRVPAGSRVTDVIAAAGGVTADADPSAVLLAALVRDGERVYVPRVGEAVPVPATVAGSTAASVTTSGPVDLNRASVAELELLPGVGPATAQAIVAHRDASGPFSSVDGLLDVRGIGPAKLDALRPLVTV